jgi:hypothetical protein
MRSKWMAAAVLATGLGAGSLAAPAHAGQANGHEVLTITCEDLGTIDVSVQPSEDNWGAVQIVGSSGHLIPVGFTFTLEDLTQGTVVFSETETKNGHRNQATTTCSFSFSGTFEEISEPGDELPPGVDADDLLRITITVEAIAKG